MFLSQACEEEEARLDLCLRRASPSRRETHGDGDHSIKPVTSGSSLDRVGDEIPRLERVAHAEGAHRDSVRDSHRAELVASNASVDEGSLDTVAEVEDVLVAAVASLKISERRESEGDEQLTGFPRTCDEQ